MKWKHYKWKANFSFELEYFVIGIFQMKYGISQPRTMPSEALLMIKQYLFGPCLIQSTRTTRTPAFWGASWLPTLLSDVGSQVERRSNDLEDPGQGQRSSHATHFLMLVIICTKYGKNPSRTVDATEWTRFSRSRLNGLENIGQGQRSFHATHPLMLVMICAKYGKNASRIVVFFKVKAEKLEKLAKNLNFRIFVINLTSDTPSNGNDYLWQIWK